MSNKTKHQPKDVDENDQANLQHSLMMKQRLLLLEKKTWTPDRK